MIKSGHFSKIKIFIISIGPGLFLIGFNIGTGSVTTMAATGAEFGMLLVWPLLISCIFTYVLILLFGRYTVVTGDTAIFSFKKYFGKPIAIFVLIALLITEMASSMGVMAVVTQVVQEWSRPLTASGKGFNTILLTFVFGTILYSLFWSGEYRFFEKVLALFVGLMGLSFLLTMFMVIPDAGDVFEGLIPKIPDGNSALLIAGMVGTTMGAVLYVVRSITIKEKEWTLNDLKIEKRDARISVILMFSLSIAVMASAAGTLHPLGLKVDNAIDMVKLLEPLAGRFAISIFVTGIVAAGLSSLFPIIILAPWLLADYKGEKANMTSFTSRMLVLGVLLLGFVVPVFGGRPVFVMIMSQAFISIVTPVIIFLMLILMNRKELVGEHRLGFKQNLLVSTIFIFSVFMSATGIFGLWSLI